MVANQIPQPARLHMTEYGKHLLAASHPWATDFNARTEPDNLMVEEQGGNVLTQIAAQHVVAVSWFPLDDVPEPLLLDLELDPAGFVSHTVELPFDPAREGVLGLVPDQIYPVQWSDDWLYIHGCRGLITVHEHWVVNRPAQLPTAA
jgi:hypothetical protein